MAVAALVVDRARPARRGAADERLVAEPTEHGQIGRAVEPGKRREARLPARAVEADAAFVDRGAQHREGLIVEEAGDVGFAVFVEGQLDEPGGAAAVEPVADGAGEALRHVGGDLLRLLAAHAAHAAHAAGTAHAAHTTGTAHATRAHIFGAAHAALAALPADPALPAHAADPGVFVIIAPSTARWIGAAESQNNRRCRQQHLPQKSRHRQDLPWSHHAARTIPRVARPSKVVCDQPWLIGLTIGRVRSRHRDDEDRPRRLLG